MTRKDLAEQVFQQFQQAVVTPSVARDIANTMVDQMILALTNRDTISLRGFATLSVYHRKSRKAFNFQQNKSMRIPGTFSVRVKPSKELIRKITIPDEMADF